MKERGINIVALLLVLVCIFALLGLPGSGELGFDASRIKPAGVVILVAGLIAEFFAGLIARNLYPSSPDEACKWIKIAALVICAAGALIIIL